MMGVFSYTGPDFITMSAPPFRIKMEDNISFGLMALYTASLMVPRLISRYAITFFFFGGGVLVGGITSKS